MEALLIVLFFILVPLILLFLLKPKTKRLSAAGRLPPGPRNLPVIGSIHQLLRRQPTHYTFRDLSAVYGPIMRLRLGEIHTFIISSSEAAREIMKTHDVFFASRPLTPTVEIISYGGKDIIVAPYGDFWRQMRRLCTLELLSAKRVLSFRAIREEEISLLIRSISQSSGAAVDVSSKFSSLSNDITARAVIGGRSEDQKIFLSALEDVSRLSSSFSIFDLFPSMPRLLGLIASHQLRRCCLKMDKILEKIVQAHKEKKKKNMNILQEGEIEEDLTDVLLKIQQDGGALQFPLSNDHVKAIINDMLMAGSETTSTTMEWAMSELIRNPEVMKKAQSEVREVLKSKISSKALVSEELMSGKLSYLSSVINETLRLHPPAPLLLPRGNQEDCEVMGYMIPAGSTVMVNAWAIGRDPNTWKEPEAFRPERFDMEDRIELKRTNFEFIPFGAGRRSCPGIHFGMSTVEMTLAYLLYYFDWRYANSAKGEKLDMTETFGVTIRRKHPLCLIATPHFPLLVV
ncbi:Cytochrome P450 71D10 [Platanthera zijinensis]|uniref:Cytochrome P450 71D10 n=1 Tax=Platanthera zijinensis TaxID=2320716 RepID=A0AAP0G822_9ASPA